MCAVTELTRSNYRAVCSDNVISTCCSRATRRDFTFNRMTGDINE